MLSDSDLNKNSMPKRRPVKAKTNLRWSDSQKIEAVQTYLLLGNLRQTAITLQIPEITVHSWKKTEWWQNLEKDMRTQENILLSNRLKQLYEKALGETADRLEKGDFVLNQKTGQLIRKPVGLRDTHKVAMDMIALKDKLTVQEHMVVAQENIAEKLSNLAAEFAKVAEKQDQLVGKIEQKPAIEVTDIIYSDAEAAGVEEQGDTDALYEEREEGLQEGE